MTESLFEIGERLLAAAAETATAAMGDGVVVPDEDSIETPADPFSGVELPAVVTEVAFAGGSPSTFVLALTKPGALRVAAVLGAIDEEAAEYGGATLDDTALAAIGQLAHRMAVAAVGDRTGGGLPPRAPARVIEDADELQRLHTAGAGAVRATVAMLGEPGVCVRIMAAPPAPAAPAFVPDDLGAPVAMPLDAALHDIDVRVWAELGRTRMPTGQVVGLPGGAIVELDREAEDAVDLYVDGQLYATGRLVVTDDDSWGVRVEHVLGLS